MECRHSNSFDTWQLSSQSSEIPSSSGLNRNWYQSVWFLENKFHIFEFQPTLSQLLLSQYAWTHTHTHASAHLVLFSLNQTHSRSFFLLLMAACSHKHTQRTSLERQQVSWLVAARPRHQPLISQINYRIATRRHHSKARKWKQKNLLLKQIQRRTENRWPGLTMQAKPVPSLFWLSNSQEQQTQLMISFSGSIEPFSTSEIT